MKRKIVIVASSVAMLAFLIPSAISAPKTPGGNLSKKLDQVAKSNLTAGYKKVTARTGELESGGALSHEFNLKADRNYAFVAVCDPNCRDIDLMVYDSDGNSVEEDTADSNSAYVVYDVPSDRAGTYEIVADMARCNKTTCKYAVGAYRE